jgi:WD40 repeat protein
VAPIFTFVIRSVGMMLLLPGSLYALQTDTQESSSTASTPEASSAKRDRYGDALPDGAVARFGTIRLRTEFWPRSIAFTPDGSQLIASDVSSRVRFWDIQTGVETKAFHLGKSDAAILSSNGNHLIVNRLDGVSMLRLSDGETVFSNNTGQGNNKNFALTEDGTVLACFPSQSHPRLLETATGAEILKFQLARKPTSGCFSPNGRMLAMTNSTNTIQLWDLFEGKLKLELLSQKGVEWNSVLFVDDNSVIGIGNRSEQRDDRLTSISHIEMWQIESPLVSKSFESRSGELLGIRSMAISRDRSLLVTTHFKKIVVWKISNLEPIRVFEISDSSIQTVAISSDNRHLAVGGYNSKPVVWNLETGQEKLRQDGTHLSSVLALDHSALDGKLLSSDEEGTTRLWNTSNGEHVAILHRNAGWTRDVKFFPDGQRAIVCGERQSSEPDVGFIGMAAIVKLSTGETLREWPLRARGIKLALNRAGTLVAIAVGLGLSFDDEPEPEIQVWDLEANVIKATLPGIKSEVASIEFETDETIRFTTDSGVYKWDLNEPTAKEYYTTVPTAQNFGKSANVELALYSQDRQIAIVISYTSDRTARKSTYTIQAVNVQDGTEIWSNTMDALRPDGMATSRDGSILAVCLASSNGESRLDFLSFSTGKRLLSNNLQGHNVRSLLFSDDGSVLFTAMHQGDILSWDVSKARSMLEENQ